MLNKVKLALRQHTTAFDEQIIGLIAAAQRELIIAGISAAKAMQEPADPLVEQFVITYCRAHFGAPEDYERLKASYDEQKAQMITATGYTQWNGEECCGQV